MIHSQIKNCNFSHDHTKKKKKRKVKKVNKLTVNDDFGLVCFSNKHFAYTAFKRQIMWIAFMVLLHSF